jgi:hypothetical protein
LFSLSFCVLPELTASIVISAVVTVIGGVGAYLIKALCSQRRKTRELSITSRNMSDEQTAMSIALSHLVDISTRIVEGQQRRPRAVRAASTPHTGKARATPRFNNPDSPLTARQTRGRRVGVSKRGRVVDETLEMTDSYVMPPPLLNDSIVPRPTDLVTPIKPHYGRNMNTTRTSCGYHVMLGAYSAVDSSETVLLRHVCECSPGNICECRYAWSACTGYLP